MKIKILHSFYLFSPIRAKSDKKTPKNFKLRIEIAFRDSIELRRYFSWIFFDFGSRHFGFCLATWPLHCDVIKSRVLFPTSW